MDSTGNFYLEAVTCIHCHTIYERIDWLRLAPNVELLASAYDYERPAICLDCLGGIMLNVNDLNLN